MSGITIKGNAHQFIDIPDEAISGTVENVNWLMVDENAQVRIADNLSAFMEWKDYERHNAYFDEDSNPVRLNGKYLGLKTIKEDNVEKFNPAMNPEHMQLVFKKSDELFNTVFVECSKADLWQDSGVKYFVKFFWSLIEDRLKLKMPDVIDLEGVPVGLQACAFLKALEAGNISIFGDLQ